ncbi:ankyrin repeat domain-containing protein 50-like isoform X1 [Haliotis rufescens]|uniref:ankyrin repeat domain-containing protein 50-like isoform X1 n=1 Tax=Haliotis rufescens TaxID=6454 RepID=UPI00201F5E76|nr:ankyrin repeat domain-containing protein 50-like isoform X1 [Haliotis rufescens]
MELTRVVFIILVSLCGVRDVHADTNLAAFSRKLNLLDTTIQAWKSTVADLGTEMSNNFDLLKEELTNTFIPALVKPLVKQAITDILKEEYIGNIISGRVLDVVNSLKTRVHNTKTQLRSVRRKFRQVKLERDSYKESLSKLRVQLTKDIQRDFQGIQQRIQELEERDALREKDIQDFAEQKQKASSDPSQTERRPVTTKKPATQASSDPSRTEGTPVTTTRTTGDNSAATPSPVDCRDLYVASRRGNLEEVKRVLSRDIDVNCRWGQWSWTPVTTAARWGHSDVVELLVSKGADVSLVDKDGDNILRLACMGGHLETVEFVLSLNVVDINSRGGGSQTPVMTAAEWRHRDVVELLVSKGADVSLVDVNGDNILHWACRAGHLATVKFVLSLNVVDINSRGWGSRTPVMRAALRRHRDVVELLVSKGADVSLVDEDGDNTLHLACYRGHLETVKFVLSLNMVDIDARNNSGRTAADVARRMGHTPVLDLLVSHGAQ